MRRFLTLAIVLLWCLGPLCALVPGSDESQLPACCRRHGAHHCDLSRVALDRALGSGPRVSAPSQCPLYHASARAITGVFTAASSPSPEHASKSLAPGTAQRRILLYQPRTSPSRGPPAA